MYEIIGDGSAPAFFNINPSSGLITVAADLTKDTLTQYLVSLSIFDCFINMSVVH